MCDIFVLLAGCTSLDVLIDLGSLRWPEVLVLDSSYCFVSAGVSSSPVVVVLPEDSSFKGVVWWVLWTRSTTSSFQSSKSKVPQVSLVIRPTHDPEK